MRSAIKPLVLAICDGFGSAPAGLQGNAVLMAETPNLMALWEDYPHTELFAHGKHVGLPPHQPGNSEAGHINIGAGRIVKQDAVYISESIEDETFYRNPAFIETLRHAEKEASTVHLMGLVSDTSAHAERKHLYGLLELCRRHKVAGVRIHVFTDGRDGPRFAAPAHVREIESRLRRNERIATVMGRFYPMDRDRNWARVGLAYHAIVNGEGLAATSAEDAVLRAYNRGETDEFIIPTVVIGKDKEPVGPVGENDALIFFNLRSDRARQLTKTFAMPDLEEREEGSFERRRRPKNIRFCAMTDFGPDLPGILTAYPHRVLKDPVTEALAGHRQLYAAESEKFPHVTYFMNGGLAEPRAKEERLKIPSDKVPRFDKKPRMKARELTTAVLEKMRTGKYHFICLNYANMDMVAHTGNLGAAVKAVEAVDEAVGRLWREVKRMGGHLIVTGDHGNVERMIDPATGAIETDHTTNPVPFMVAGAGIKGYRELPRGVLGDVAPTALELMGIPKPEEMTGRSLLSA